MSAPVRVLADAGRLSETTSVRFVIEIDGVSRDAFAVRYRGEIRAFVNTCRHEGRTLDFGDGHFFDETCDALVCVHHGARYQPETGVCFEGPCLGARLTPLKLERRGPELWCLGAERERDLGASG
jgi:nitrite reductase/ring-hydroxylating ferredoxin subunit